MTSDPHRNQPVRMAGAPLENASAAVILLHGRGASAHDILSLAGEMYDPRVVYLAPEAANGTWYPYSFLAPTEQNEPWLSSALGAVGSTVELATGAGIARDRVVLCGFSQGACLTSEFLARNPARYGAAIAFTGGLVGPVIEADAYTGGLAGTPVFLGSGDPDPHVPWSRVEETAHVLRRMGAQVATRRYPGRPHTVSAEELTIGRDLILAALSPAREV